MEKGGEMYNFIKVWLLILASLSYCFSIAKIIPKGNPRLCLFLPIIVLFLVLPLNLNCLHFRAITSIFISWLANFKLLLYAFDKGPLFSNPPISFIQFLTLACFPIEIKNNPSHESHSNHKNKENPFQNGQNYEYPIDNKFHKSILSYAIMFILLAMLTYVHEYYREFLHPKAILILFCCRVYFIIVFLLAIPAFLAQAVLGCELKPHFNKPHLSTSLQNFWGKRWNIMFGNVLRQAVYNPVVKICSPIVSRRWASLPAIMCTFIASAIMHELTFYYIGCLKSIWEINLFLLLHGVCVTMEVGLKKVVDRRWCLPVWITRPLTVGFVVFTAFWIFLSPLLRCKIDVRVVEEYAALYAYMKEW